MPNEIEQAEEVLGKCPPTLETEAAGCHQCLRVYPSPIGWLCPHCYGQGHKYRLKSLNEAKWWVKFYGWKLEQGSNIIYGIWLNVNNELVAALERSESSF